LHFKLSVSKDYRTDVDNNSLLDKPCTVAQNHANSNHYESECYKI